MSKKDLYTCLSEMGYVGTLEAMQQQYLSDTTKVSDIYIDQLLGIGPPSVNTVEDLIGDYTSETLFLLNRMSVRPDSDRRSAIDTLIRALKSTGVWAKLDALWVLAAHDSQAALLNWTGNSALLPNSGTTLIDLTAFNSPVFTPDRGFASDGATSYLSARGSGSGIKMTGLKMRAGDEEFGCWCLNSVVHADAQSMTMGTSSTGGSGRHNLNPFNTASQIAWRINFETRQTSGSQANGMGLIAIANSAGSAFEYKNGAQDDTYSASLSYSDYSSETWYVNIGRSGLYSTRQTSAAFFGSALTAQENAYLYNALANYMQTVGAIDV